MIKLYFNLTIFCFCLFSVIAKAGELKPNAELLERLMVERPECFAKDDNLLSEIVNKANLGDPVSVYCLAERYYFGHGVTLNHRKAEELFEIAGTKGYSGAMSSVCELNLYGRDVKHDYN